MKTLRALIGILLLAASASAQTKVIVGGGGGSSAALAIGDAITGGTATRVLYEGAGNVLAESASFTFDGSVVSAAAFNVPVSAGLGYDFGSGQGRLAHATGTTPDSVVFLTGTNSNVLNVFEFTDFSYDFQNGPCGTSTCTDPMVITRTSVTDTTQYNATAAWGNAGGAVKALTESAATALVRISVPTNSRASGELVYEIYATDGTDMQVRSSRIRYAMTNKAGTESCSLTAMDGVAATAQTDDDNASNLTAGTLTYGIACTNNVADTMDITFNAVSSLVQTTLQATWSVKHLSPGQPLRQ